MYSFAGSEQRYNYDTLKSCVGNFERVRNENVVTKIGTKFGAE